MAFINRDMRLLKRSYWMVSHRWVAIVTVAALTWFGPQLLNVEIQSKALYLLTVGLIVENLITLLLLQYIRNQKRFSLNKLVRLVIHFQIICDLLILTGILHYSGGIENPLFLVYIFHMVIASILLSKLGAFAQTTFALLLFGAMTFLEYSGQINHYCLCLDGVPNYCLHEDFYFSLRTFGVFAFTSYILVYLTTSIGQRLRDQEERLTSAIQELRRNDEIKNEYVLRITHDIKSHLAAIQTNLSVLVDEVFGSFGSKQKEFLYRSYNRTILLTNFAKNMLQMTQLRLENKIKKEIFSLNELITKTVKNLEENIQDKNITVKLDFDKSVDLFKGNLTSFESVFQNLLGNALKYSDKNGSIAINTKDRKHKIRIEVKDSGIGVPYKELNKIFNEFYRATNVKDIGAKGSGVGLSLVKEIIKRHNGRIWAESNNPDGTRFIFELPKL